MTINDIVQLTNPYVVILALFLWFLDRLYFSKFKNEQISSLQNALSSVQSATGATIEQLKNEIQQLKEASTESSINRAARVARSAEQLLQKQEQEHKRGTRELKGAITRFKSRISELGKVEEELKKQMSEMEEERDYLEEQVARFRCPHCHAVLTESRYDEGDYGEGYEQEHYECGYYVVNGEVTDYCPRDPDPPQLEDYELKTAKSRQEGGGWICLAVARNERGKKLSFGLRGWAGSTEESARDSFIKEFRRIMKRSAGTGM